MRTSAQNRPAGVAALSLFFVAGSLICLIATLSLLWPAGPLEPMWRLNPRGHDAFVVMGAWAVVLLLLVCAACGTTAAGLWIGAAWGRRVAIALLVINLAGDVANTFLGTERRAVIGIFIAGAILGFLFTERARQFFRGRQDR